MYSKTEKTFKELLAHNHSQFLSQITTKALYLKKINYLVQKCLASPLNNYCRVANLRDSHLIIQTESPVWATRLRYHLPDLLCKLQMIPELRTLQSIECYVHPHTTQKYTTVSSHPLQPPTLSCKNARLIEEIAANIKDIGLQQALKRLAKNGDL